ncbi:heavy metal translocating P-type ATPase protein (plasmid) [Rhizobium etli]|uniref:P-type Zn(2+) transporter n=2 Tax=Rhizobium etli TaxID=29449 RepID=A0AAN1BJQ3_RHIET|nr:heavy metal translocating P-type ATPase protein [Rhizobium etli]
MTASNLDLSGPRGARPTIMSYPLRQLRPVVLILLSTFGIVASIAFRFASLPAASSYVLAGCIVVTLLSLAVDVVAGLRAGEFGLDFLAAVAMASALWFGENLAGAIVAVMYAGGQFLEAYAYHRADEGMSDLLAKIPRTARRLRGEDIEEVSVETIAPEDIILVRCGDVVTADGILQSKIALLNQALLTGEALPARLVRGSEVMSGTVNLGDAVEIRVLRSAKDSAYAGIVNLVEAGKRSKAKLVRLADRYALAFLSLALAIAAASAIVSGDLHRVVAVLVVATPCPLILAVPVALAAGTSKAARQGILVKGSGPLEALAAASVVVFDKTGTLTLGEPVVTQIDGPEDPDEVLRLAASLDQASAHVAAVALLKEARRRHLRLSRPSEVVERPGAGITGLVDGQRISVGSENYVERQEGVAPGGPNASTALRATVMINGKVAGVITMEDRLRSDARATIDRLRTLGIKRLVLASGDERSIAAAVASTLSLGAVKARLSPADKVAVIKEERAGGSVLMVGDGVNDAPALAAADVGMAIGSQNLAAAAQAADIVLVRDSLRGIVDAITTARRARNIALQSVLAGMGLSILAMIAAGLGYLPPVAGAMLQEVIDVAVIMNALRALH